MIKVCCFDLDGTLLQMDTDKFIENYMRSVAVHMAPVIDPHKLGEWIWAATGEMIKSQDAEATNQQVFDQHFLALCGMEKEKVWPHFDEFYEKKFSSLKQYSLPSPHARPIVQAAINAGFKVVIATNPLFPKTAILERMRWCEVDDLPFEWVTVYEESHFSKPNPLYYKEIADKLNVLPDQCVMIGNDMQEDMVASKIGMKTYLVTNHMIDRGNTDYQVDQKGTLDDLLLSIQNKEGIFSNE